MAQENEDRALELRRLARVLEKTAQMAEHSSLAGTLAQGRGYAAGSYNRVLEHLQGRGEIATTLFTPLGPDAGMEEIGMASAQLAAYLEAGLPDRGRRRRAGAEVIGDGNVIIGGIDDLVASIREGLSRRSRGVEPKRTTDDQGPTTNNDDQPPTTVPS